MKKRILIFFVLLVALLFSFVLLQKNSEDNDIPEVKAIVNQQWKNDDGSDEYNSCVCVLDTDNLSFSYVEVSEGIYNIFQLGNGGYCTAEEKEGNIVLRVYNDESVEYELKLNFIPDQIFETEGEIILRKQTELYKVDLNNLAVNYWKQIKENTTVYFSDTMFCYNDADGISVHSRDFEKHIDTKAFCLDVIDSDTLLLAKEIPLSFLIYRYSISDGKKSDLCFVSDDGYIFHAAVSAEKTYLLCFSSDGEGMLKPYLLNLETMKKTKCDFKCDCVNSIQILN